MRPLYDNSHTTHPRPPVGCVYRSARPQIRLVEYRPLQLCSGRIQSPGHTWSGARPRLELVRCSKNAGRPGIGSIVCNYSYRALIFIIIHCPGEAKLYQEEASEARCPLLITRGRAAFQFRPDRNSLLEPRTMSRLIQFFGCSCFFFFSSSSLDKGLVLKSNLSISAAALPTFSSCPC